MGKAPQRNISARDLLLATPVFDQEVLIAHIFQIGVTGGVGSRLAPMLLATGHSVSGLHRKPEQANDLKSSGISPRLGDLMDMTASDIADAIRGADAVVFSAGAAGSGKDRATVIDGDGPVKLVQAAHSAGVRRIYLVSVFMDAGRDRDLGEGFEHYMKQKRRADNALAASGLDYVIVRPGTLKDDDGNGCVSAGRAIPYGDVARGNVAALLAELIGTPELRRDIVEVTNGTTPVPEAVKDLLSR